MASTRPRMMVGSSVRLAPLRPAAVAEVLLEAAHAGELRSALSGGWRGSRGVAFHAKHHGLHSTVHIFREDYEVEY